MFTSVFMGEPKGGTFSSLVSEIGGKPLFLSRDDEAFFHEKEESGYRLDRGPKIAHEIGFVPIDEASDPYNGDPLEQLIAKEEVQILLEEEIILGIYENPDDDFDKHSYESLNNEDKEDKFVDHDFENHEDSSYDKDRAIDLKMDSLHTKESIRSPLHHNTVTLGEHKCRLYESHGLHGRRPKKPRQG